jgi:cystathionine beta-lyase/cystathionine gamma-synthase
MKDDWNTVYRRAQNSTVTRLEDAVAALDGHVPDGMPLNAEGVAFASGMAATSAVVVSRVAAGLRHVLAVRPLYGGTDGLLESGLLGTDVTFVEPDGNATAKTGRTGLIVLETPSNPTLELRDVKPKHHHRPLVAVRSTPLDHPCRVPRGCRHAHRAPGITHPPDRV